MALKDNFHQFKLLFCFLFLIFSSVQILGQTNFENGYFIDNSGQKTMCLIKNIDWLNNPVNFDYKLNENGEINTQNISDVKEFGIINVSKYERHSVDIDRSSNKLVKLTPERNPVFLKEKLFLKVLVEGKSTLYSYNDGDIYRLFFNSGDETPEQLVFKKYLSEDNKIGKNTYYKQQLFNSLKCSEITLSDIERLEYKSKDLTEFFETYNLCNNSLVTNYEKKDNRKLFHMRAKAGLGTSSLSIANSPTSEYDLDFDNEILFRFGLEAEVLLPFNSNKWSIVLEPSIQSYTSSKEKSNPPNTGVRTTVKGDATYSTVEIPLGIRHYFFLNETSNIFINGYYNFILTGKSNIKFDSGTELDIEKSSGQALGLGYSQNKLSLEFRYEFTRNILGRYITWSSDYNQMSLILGYKLF